ncbi:hypothetical protein JRG18_11450 [Kocuria palustris]|uniref:hypothetical protein n=1 Tax=Kocuria palustris TaxID=71999 RepID=UPI00045E7FE6|nr:hypothetical protein [Kocuria palustris]MBN6753498.1 hypothetical protein [Kocuria palustris]MBN6759077.1 hypothetical protein [Kocuria palustris]MBN6763590.1 hypothetical protein [Kocuria palustris]MBN6783003.1 hypothetical protein [Kocuria palustris]MBN6799521.1 hypothetical protein [Kocuria palustris]
MTDRPTRDELIADTFGTSTPAAPPPDPAQPPSRQPDPAQQWTPDPARERAEAFFNTPNTW